MNIVRCLIPAALIALGSACSTTSSDEGWVRLFDGEGLSGWRGHQDLWAVRDGAITGRTQDSPKLTHNTFLVYEGGEFGDFELELAYRIVGGNSGVQYRSRLLSEGEFGPIVGGYQADIEAGRTYSGILYEERGRGILAQRGQETVVREGADGKTVVDAVGSVGDSSEIQAAIKDEDWNQYRIVARGNHLQQFINGVQTVDVVDEQASAAAKSGLIALQLHVGPPMTVQFKDIRIRPLAGE